MNKTIQELTIKEIFEDLEHYLNQLQLQSPPFCDNGHSIVREYVEELKLRIEKNKKYKTLYQRTKAMLDIYKTHVGNLKNINIDIQQYFKDNHLERIKEEEEVES